MTYATLAEVKALLRETTTDHDTEITTSTEDGDYYIDALMQMHTTVPLTSPPNEIKRASKYLGASLYLSHNPMTKQGQFQAELWWKIGETIVQSYIMNKYYQGLMKSG